MTNYYELLMLSCVSLVVEYNEIISQGTINVTSEPKCDVMNILRVTLTTIQHVWQTEGWSICLTNTNVKLLGCEMLTSCIIVLVLVSFLLKVHIYNILLYLKICDYINCCDH